MKNSKTPATDMNRSAERTLNNWRKYVGLQICLKAIESAEHLPFACIATPMMREQMYDSIFVSMPAGQA